MVNWTHEYEPLGEHPFVGQNLKEHNDGSTTFDVGTTAFRVLVDQTLQYKDAAGVCGAVLPTWYKDAYVLVNGGEGHIELDKSWLQNTKYAHVKSNLSEVIKAYAVALAGQPQANEILKLEEPRKLSKAFNFLKRRALRVTQTDECVNGVPSSASEFIEDLQQIQRVAIFAHETTNPAYMSPQRYALRQVRTELDTLRSELATQNPAAVVKIGADGINTVVRLPGMANFNVVNTKNHYLIYGDIMGVMRLDQRLANDRDAHRTAIVGHITGTLGAEDLKPNAAAPSTPINAEDAQARRKQQVVELPLF